jgi:NAD(P)-dependent dehydrogenase (short-subunit alcohol dehydrogenase family)
MGHAGMLKRWSDAEVRPKTVLITGASRGIGEATARLFLDKGWSVAATMRTPEASQLRPSNQLKVYQMDVASPVSITDGIATAIEDFGRIDVVVNNAGHCIVGALEELSDDDLQAVLDTNILGAMRVTRAALPHMRACGGGRIVNVSSMCGQMTLPLYTAYCASKWGLEGFSESLAFETRAHGIRVKIVEPGVHKTGSFTSQLADHAARPAHSSYSGFSARVLPRLGAFERSAPPAGDVAHTIYKAATDRWPRLRYPVGSHAVLFARRLIPSSLYVRAVRRVLGAW